MLRWGFLGLFWATSAFPSFGSAELHALWWSVYLVDCRTSIAEPRMQSFDCSAYVAQPRRQSFDYRALNTEIQQTSRGTGSGKEVRDGTRYKESANAFG